ncbi:hypothetical protein LCGC14_0932180 [marine sediment metagenome]|uniref:Uncharacterized protein n=1 Tax=marine sediment metagenome TaxID=412755 RepID=A0A0F9RU78_9ZZZZ|nr:efflux RND transporter periplasmic adaptor subunit [Candidatus Aminicenantes bacterium]
MKDKIICFLVVLVFLTAFGCTSKKDAARDDEYSVALTEWSEKLEVFMEYQMPTPGEEISFGVHLTDLSDFKPITEGVLELEFINESSGQKSVARADHPIRDGIFTPKHTFDETGVYKFGLILESSKVSGRLNLGTIQVYESLSPQDDDEKKSLDEVSFLKEQQWKMDFRVGSLQKHTITQTISVPGKIVPAAYKMAKISPPLDGKIAIDKNIALPRQGDMVRSGDVLAIIEPSLASFSSSDEYQIDLEVENSKTKLKLAQSELERLKKLFEKDAVPKKRLLESEAGFAIAEANYNKALKKKKAFQKIKLQPGSETQSSYYYLRSPIAGRIVDLKYILGEQVKAGEIIMTILDDTKVWLEISVFENDINKIKNSRGGYFISTDKSKTYGIAQYKGKLIFSGSVIDENTRTVSTIYEISNPLSEFLVGSFVTAYLNTAEAIETLAIPKSAVFDSGGNKVCFIQLGGETFEKRAIELGPEGQNYIQILAGALEGEKVVVQGGYAVKLAAEASGKKVGEGHFH